MTLEALRVFNPFGRQVGRTGLPQGRRARCRRRVTRTVAMPLVPLMLVGLETVAALNQEALLYHAGVAAALGQIGPRVIEKMNGNIQGTCPSSQELSS